MSRLLPSIVRKMLIFFSYLCVLSNPAFADPVDPRFAQVGEEMEAPPGYYDFCMAHLALCDNEDRKPQDIHLSPDNLAKLTQINVTVNKQINQISDAQHFGKNEYWTLPRDGKGDCEDISIYKRLQMIKAGFPVQALLLTQVIAPKEGSHIVLTIKTDKGEFIADNLVDDLKLWLEVPYKFIRRQSQYQQNVWVGVKATNMKLSLTHQERKDIKRAGSIRKKRYNSLFDELKDKQSYRNPCGKLG